MVNLVRLRPPKSWSSPEDHLWAAINHPWYRAIQKIQSDLYRATNCYFESIGFDPVLMPVTTGAVSSPMGLGSDSLPVQVKLYSRDVFLADSMQFHLEYLLRHETPGVYYIMPTFRNENSSPRHLNEFHHSEAELRGSFEDVVRIILRYTRTLAQELLTRHGPAICAAAGTTKHIEAYIAKGDNIPRISYEEARRILEGQPDTIQSITQKAFTITAKGERWLMNYVCGPLLLTHPPHLTVPFYQAYSDDGYHAQAADLLMGIGETVGCGERHVDAENLIRALQSHQISADMYAWYVNLKRRFPLRTSGFGMGIERFLLWILNHDDIRDIPLIPRIQEIVSTP